MTGNPSIEISRVGPQLQSSRLLAQNSPSVGPSGIEPRDLPEQARYFALTETRIVVTGTTIRVWWRLRNPMTVIVS